MRPGSLRRSLVAMLLALCWAGFPNGTPRAGESPPLTAGSAVSKPVSLMIPQDNAALPPGRTLLIGRVAPGAGALVRIEVNGKIATFASTKEGAFSAIVSLPSGKNEIGLVAGTVRETVAVTASEGAGYRYHPDAGNCGECHAEGSGFKLAAPVETLCRRCHPGKNRGKYVHGPLGAGSCTACHDPHGAPNARLHKSGKGCFACHDPFPGGKFVHAPAARGNCTGCHNPHASDLPTHLVKEGNDLCTGCHATVHPIHRNAVTKAAAMTRVPGDFPLWGEELACPGCHAPHYAREKQLLRGDREALCKRCHAF